MRLFVAINFTGAFLDAVCEAVAELRAAALRGRYPARENLHLTLAFIGESTRVDDILDIMDEVSEELAAADGGAEPIALSLSGAGMFGGRGGDLHWVGVAHSPRLKKLAVRLADALRAEGFDIERRRFTPHITIGRQVVLAPGAQIRVPAARMEAHGMSLMRSDRVKGRLVYTEVGYVAF
ncbi:MAG: RNA 2',3'-cyclic phosphodiesterase [Clostridiales Family XIII bacterium]|jgi:2'-5' RNA ligase|nr:RNA 2',3'-cyclic phosphodiesterase [Clostridiales Family XIII bacterium]